MRRARALPALLYGLIAGCGGGVTPRGPSPERAAVDDPSVIATVDGVAIRAADVKRQAEAAGSTARQALDALIEAELAAAEARRRGLESDPAVREAANQALVRRYLEETFEKQVTRAAVTEEDVAAAYHNNLLHYERPDAVEVDHILAIGTPKDTPQRRAALRARAEEVAARARKVKDRVEFETLAAALSDATIQLRIESLTAPRYGVVEEPFAAAAFALAKPGDVSGVVESSYGFHVIYLAAKLPAIHRSLDDARPELIEGLYPNVRKRAFARLVDELMTHARMEVYPGRLDEKHE